MKTKWVTLNTWIFVIGLVIFAAIHVTNYLTDGFKTVGPFLG